MNDNIKIIHLAILSSLLFFYGNTLAQAKMTLNFEQWKQQQEKHDLRLQQQSPAALSAPTTVQALPFVHGAVPSQTVKQEEGAPPRAVLGTGIKVNINRATAQELSAKLESIGAKKAQAIIAYRNQHGKFKHVNELKNVKGIGEKIFELNRDRIKLND